MQSGLHVAILSVYWAQIVNVTQLSRSGMTALHLSSIQGHGGTCKLLVESKSDINARDHRCNLYGFQNIHIESAFENDFSLLYFYSQKTALHLCVENDQVEVFRLLLAANANVDARDVEYEWSLFFASIAYLLLQRKDSAASRISEWCYGILPVAHRVERELRRKRHQVINRLFPYFNFRFAYLHSDILVQQQHCSASIG
jgi:hypothetical protein